MLTEHVSYTMSFFSRVEDITCLDTQEESNANASCNSYSHYHFSFVTAMDLEENDARRILNGFFGVTSRDNEVNVTSNKKNDDKEIDENDWSKKKDNENIVGGNGKRKHRDIVSEEESRNISPVVPTWDDGSGNDRETCRMSKYVDILPHDVKLKLLTLVHCDKKYPQHYLLEENVNNTLQDFVNASLYPDVVRRGIPPGFNWFFASVSDTSFNLYKPHRKLLKSGEKTGTFPTDQAFVDTRCIPRCPCLPCVTKQVDVWVWQRCPRKNKISRTTETILSPPPSHWRKIKFGNVDWTSRFGIQYSEARANLRVAAARYK